MPHLDATDSFWRGRIITGLFSRRPRIVPSPVLSFSFLLRVFEFPGRIVSPTFDIVFLRNGRKLCLSAELSALPENNLRMSVIFRDLPMNLDRFPRQLPYVSHFAQVAGKDHNREWTLMVVVTEIQECGAARAGADGHNLAGNTFRVANVRGSLVHGQAN